MEPLYKEKAIVNSRTDNSQTREKDPNEIGALWTKQTKNGHDYFSGSINGQRIVVFKNWRKKNDKQPDWFVLRSTPQANGQGD